MKKLIIYTIPLFLSFSLFAKDILLNCEPTEVRMTTGCHTFDIKMNTEERFGFITFYCRGDVFDEGVPYRFSIEKTPQQYIFERNRSPFASGLKVSRKDLSFDKIGSAGICKLGEIKEEKLII